MKIIATKAIYKLNARGGFVNVATLLLFALQISPFFSFSQQRSANITFSDQSKAHKCRILKVDSLSINNSLENCLLKYRSRGYIAARLDSVSFNSTNTKAWGFLGARFRWNITPPDSTLAYWLNVSGQPYSSFKSRPVNSFEIAGVSDKLILSLENNGYPFANVATKVQQVDSNLLAINYALQQGPFIAWDTLVVKGDARVSQRFIARYIGFSKSKAYSESFLNRINSKIDELPYLSSIRKAEVEFLSKTAHLYLYINNRKANRFSGIIGVSSDKASNSGIQLTGDLNLMLWNSFRNGEYIFIKWAGLGEGTQHLNTAYSIPFIAASSIGAEFCFKMQKQDSSFLNVNPRGALTFQSNGGFVTSLGVELKKSNVLTSQVVSSNRNFTTLLYQLKFQKGIYSASEFPRSGMFFGSSFAAGRQNYSQTGVSKRRSISNVQGKFSVTFPVAAQFLLARIATVGQAMFELSGSSELEKFTENELYRIGGAENLRGFNQESILTDRYAVATAELHLIAKQAASIYIFTDLANVSQISNLINRSTWANGVGVGTLLNTGNGILNFSFAMGNGFGQVISFRDSKVHIGYVAGF
jgi:outer membrane translocation and assembly module TamA